MEELTTLKETEYRRVDQTGETYYAGVGLSCSSCGYVWKKEEALGFDYCPHCGKKIKKEKKYEDLSLYSRERALTVLKYIREHYCSSLTDGIENAIAIVKHDIEIVKGEINE